MGGEGVNFLQFCADVFYEQPLKGRVHCFSMRVVMNKYFLLNSEKKFGADPSYR